jgi:hypothetical protein
MKKVPAIAVIGVLLASCAEKPSAITPATIPTNAFENMSCEELTVLSANAAEDLAALEIKQTQAANGDAFGVFLIGVPLSSVAGGDKAGDVAVAKGRVIAIEAVREEKKCFNVTTENSDTSSLGG